MGRSFLLVCDKQSENRAISEINAHTRRFNPRFFKDFSLYKKSPSFDIWFSKLVQEKTTVIIKKIVAPFDAFSAVSSMVCPAKRNSIGSLETTSFEKFTPNTLKAVMIKKSIGISEVKK